MAQYELKNMIAMTMNTHVSDSSSATAASLKPSTRFCAQCGNAVEYRIPDDDSRVRAVCPSCGFVHYDNPKMVVGTLAVFEGKVLLCRRAIEPGYGLWTLPAGFMECGESLAQGALRETLEEACAQVHLIEPVYHIVDIPFIGQTHFFFRAELAQAEFGAGDETLETRLFAIDELPWADIVFESTRSTLRAWIDDSARGVFSTRHSLIQPRPDDHRR